MKRVGDECGKAVLAEAVREASLRRGHYSGDQPRESGGGRGEHSRQRAQCVQRPRGRSEQRESQDQHEGLCTVFRATLSPRHRNPATCAIQHVPAATINKDKEAGDINSRPLIHETRYALT